MAKPVKPGTPAPKSGQYRPATPGGKPKPGTTEVTVVEGKPLPPSSKPGESWVIVDPTKHKKN